MKDYARKTGQYVLPHSAYNRAVAFVRDYPRLKALVIDIIEESPAPSETPGIQKLLATGSPTETKAIKISPMMQDIRLLEDSLLAAVPPESRDAILGSIIAGYRYPSDKSTRTYSTYKQKFLYEIALRKGYIYEETL